MNSNKIIENKLIDEFNNSSVVFIENLVNKKLCNEAINYFHENEYRIIEKYKNDKKGIATEKINGKELIKYFEYPLAENCNLFGKFLNSNIYEYAEKLLSEKVYLKSFEIHSRCALGSEIPHHQDNGYYGLNNADGLTFYIPLNDQNASEGGLQYLRVKNDTTFEHTGSNANGFSLAIKDLNIFKGLEIISPNYHGGDCTIHHSNSIHFAEDVPPNTKRGLVVRMSFYSEKSTPKKGHKEWYQKMIQQNRIVNNS